MKKRAIWKETGKHEPLLQRSTKSCGTSLKIWSTALPKGFRRHISGCRSSCIVGKVTSFELIRLLLVKLHAPEDGDEDVAEGAELEID